MRTTSQPASASNGATRRRVTRALTVAAATGAALALWIVTGPVAGIELTVDRAGATAEVGPAAVAFAAVVSGLAGWALLAVLERSVRRSKMVWTSIALIVLVLSLVGPLAQARTGSATAVLAGLHLLTGTIIIAGMASSAVPARPAHSTAEETRRVAGQ
ncbi:DUF6069 family protein [Solwaraspora sp. WMMD1047]|uniref:DUF6069 family protein n=1 Tax=Solwaraspora sp. WMMD1047 TaxID=3016102 RepID=UPI002417AAC5|nr:DUF6069 family protein [Solwaraspora sp. WMMD1047]MDG4829124.1 DUF6069 family protein [Solwaraspora sp. WMMD1047]